MKSSSDRKESNVNLNDIFIGFLFLTTASFFVSSFINAKMSDKSIYNSSQHLTASQQ